ncbi:cytochrome c maturation protein CcmE [Acidipila sp. EB88]|uniref:cytochrome c maturation protein CcmE n=1 Tax=Acidipila sp. EB88 TaxID=2305226 RepID=UPI000F5F8BE8|nr:cytochrome c maturation protein CcmE [Acidipila sp. EB88]RRA49793.1 cytochrome c maturation protein CcmE [Acidipila sp. EB88]
MASGRPQSIRISVAVAIVLAVIAYLAVTGVQANKSYYVTINELQGMGQKAYTRHLRVAGNVQPGSIAHRGAGANFVLVENDKHLSVEYAGTEPPPDTFKDNSQALAIGMYGRDGVFHATELQAKCASKYAPKQASPATPATRAAANTGTTVPAAVATLR